MCLAAASYALAASSAVSNVPSHNLAPRFGSRISAAQLPHGRCLTPRYCDVVAFFDCLSPLPPCVRRRASSVTSTPAFDALSLSRALDLAITTVPIARPRLVVLCRSLASRSPRVRPARRPASSRVPTIPPRLLPLVLVSRAFALAPRDHRDHRQARRPRRDPASISASARRDASPSRSSRRLSRASDFCAFSRVRVDARALAVASESVARAARSSLAVVPMRSRRVAPRRSRTRRSRAVDARRRSETCVPRIC